MSQDAAEAHVRAAAALLGLELDEASRRAVTDNVRILQAMQAKFMGLPLPDDLDPGPLLRL
jgi:hypothetical protein